MSEEEKRKHRKRSHIPESSPNDLGTQCIFSLTGGKSAYSRFLTDVRPLLQKADGEIWRCALSNCSPHVSRDLRKDEKHGKGSMSQKSLGTSDLDCDSSIRVLLNNKSSWGIFGPKELFYLNAPSKEENVNR
ncbi:hypothetical protein TNCV_97151 [Trichonephila clavipes]|nr:hypothetical protein TNCV_97151 [Trichonephila clavipes]